MGRARDQGPRFKEAKIPGTLLGPWALVPGPAHGMGICASRAINRHWALGNRQLTIVMIISITISMIMLSIMIPIFIIVIIIIAVGSGG